ncbi:hypothetical protein ABVF54_12630 [Enterococcus mundtii]|uniref:hypothetical protein n=1 Tax=Enterococcus mundtii TaxID=53346 RepID=UPI003369C995
MKSLIIWLPTGQTMKFEDVQDLTAKPGVVTFNYLGVSTGVRRDAVFDAEKLLGWALEQEKWE